MVLVALDNTSINRMESMLFLARTGQVEWREALSNVQRVGSGCADKCEEVGACQAAAAGNLRLVSSKAQKS